MLVQGLKFEGLVINRQPKIDVLFEVKALKIRKIVSFLIDTGANHSGITEREARIMGIDCAALPDHKKESIGFGGTFRNKMINREIVLTFQSRQGSHKIKCSNFIVIHVPLTITGEVREKMLRHTPNILGMDILNRFKLYVDKNRVELSV